MASSDEPNGDYTPVTPVSPSSSPLGEARGEARGEPQGEANVHDNGTIVNASSDYTYSSGQAGNATTYYTPPPVSRALPPAGGSGGGGELPPPPSDEGGSHDEESGMLRMSFLEHLEELRKRIIYAALGLGAAFAISFAFCKQLWNIVAEPAVKALTQLGIHPPNLVQITPMENFNVIYVKVPLLCSIFIASPWLLYQVWAFVSPGLYKRERRWAVPFVLSTAGLFVMGGLFAFFVAFRFGLVFLLGIGRDVHVTPMVSINEYFDLFVNVTLGIALVFEMPILIFFLTLLHIVTPKFLISNSRYAILIITIIAAVVTPTPDVFNLLLFATPMIVLFFVGVFASYLLVLSREGRKFPWAKVLLVAMPVLAALGGITWLLLSYYHFHFLGKWPFLSR
jgi:sec-independent protein translocase protein TatC